MSDLSIGVTWISAIDDLYHCFCVKDCRTAGVRYKQGTAQCSVYLIQK